MKSEPVARENPSLGSESEREQCKLLSKLLAGQTRILHFERKTTANTLHDELQQMLFGIMMRLNAISRDFNDPRLAKPVETVYRSAQQAIDRMRELSSAIFPPILRLGSMSDVFVWIASEVKDEGRFTINYSSSSEIQKPAEELKYVVYDAVRETLMHLSRHSRGKEAWMRASCEGGELLVQIVDKNPQIDDPSYLESSLFSREARHGLLCARELIATHGGSWKFNLSPENELLIEIRVPMSEPDTVQSFSGN